MISNASAVILESGSRKCFSTVPTLTFTTGVNSGMATDQIITTRIPSNHRLAERKLIEFVNSAEWRIDDHGRIWKGLNVRAEKILPSGYMMVRRMKDGKRIVGLSHRLVWQYFLGDIPAGMTINHKNGIKDDNRLVNLEVRTYSENTIHAYRSGLRDEHGQRNPAAKLSDNQVAQIRLAYAGGGFTMKALGEKFGVRFQHISRLVRGQRRPKQGGPVKTNDLRHSTPERDPITKRFIRSRVQEFPK